MNLATGVAAIQDGHIRLTILQLLSAQAEYQANDMVLAAAVNSMGLICTADQMRGHLGWLEEQRLVTTINAGIVIVATMTERGGDVAAGRSQIKGVQRPAPGG